MNTEASKERLSSATSVALSPELFEALSKSMNSDEPIKELMTKTLNLMIENDHCVDRATLKPLSDGYRLVHALLKCSNPEGCACGKTQCEENKYCMNGLCFRDPFTKKFGSKIYYYRFVRTNDSLDDAIAQSILYEDENKTVEQYEKELKSYDSKIMIQGYNSLNHDMTIGELLKTCGGGTIPKDVATKYCYIQLIQEEGQCGGNYILQFSGWQDDDYWKRVHHSDFDWEPDVTRPQG